jgi:hypothetical protein
MPVFTGKHARTWQVAAASAACLLVSLVALFVGSVAVALDAMIDSLTHRHAGFAAVVDWSVAALSLAQVVLAGVVVRSLLAHRARWARAAMSAYTIVVAVALAVGSALDTGWGVTALCVVLLAGAIWAARVRVLPRPEVLAIAWAAAACFVLFPFSPDDAELPWLMVRFASMALAGWTAWVAVGLARGVRPAAVQAEAASGVALGGG